MTRNLLNLAIMTMMILTITSAPAYATETEILVALTRLKGHIEGTLTLTDTQIADHKATIDANKTYLGSSEIVMTTAFDLVETYDAINGPLWVNGSQMAGEFDRNTVTDDIHWTTFNVMQHIMDYTYTNANLAAYEALLGAFKYGSAEDFPGHVDPPSDPNIVHTATISASFKKSFGHDTFHWADVPARKPTGTYLAPGTVATITVPPSIVGNGYQVRIGAHSWDLSGKSRVLRLDRVSLLYDIDSTQVKVSSPLGGGIYIDVPYLADAGIVDVQIQNAALSPFFSAKSFHSTTLEEWQTFERDHQAPWADFQSEKFMMQVPTDWIYALNDPVTLMEDWDKAMDATNDLMGFPHIRGKEAGYDQVDVIIRGGAYHPGWPSSNNPYNPNTNYGGNHDHYLVRGPQNYSFAHFHEMGHGYLFQKFSGEVESVVNLLHVAVWNRKFGYDLDYAFNRSMYYDVESRTLDKTAVCWMMCQNFKNNNEMDQLEKQYQLKGHAKFVDIVRMFSWDVLGDYWRSFNDDYENGVSWNTDDDTLLLRLSKAVGYDIRPLFRFWGVHPTWSDSLAAAFETENIPVSAEIYDMLVKYKALVPAGNAEFQAFALDWWGYQPTSAGYMTEQDHASIWDTYDAAYADIIRTNVQNVIDQYFPDGPGWKLKPSHYSYTDASKYVALEWKDIAVNETGYVLERSSDGGSIFDVIVPLDANTESYTDTDILQDSYHYRLKTVHAVGSSTTSDVLYVDLSTRLRPNGPTVQAEDYTDISGCSVDDSDPNYIHVAMGVADTWFEWDNVYFGIDMACTLEFHYASVGGKPCQVSVNGMPAGSVSFPSTGSLSTWSTDTIDVKLNAGTNIIRVTADPGAGPNIDKMQVVPGAGSGDFICDGIINLVDFAYMAGVWLDSDYMADIAAPADDEVGVPDLLVLARQWLSETGLPDTTPPVPDAASFATGPIALGETSITMIAVKGYDSSDQVEYYFDEVSGNPGGLDSGWISSDSYTDVGLNADTTYSYTVTMRDAYGNETAPSDVANTATWLSTTSTIVWDPAGNGITPPAAGDWSHPDNWTTTADGRPNGNFKCVTNMPDAAEAVVNDYTAFYQLAHGDNGAEDAGVIRIVDGGTMDTGQTWSAIAYNRQAKMIVETGGVANFGGHLWVGFTTGGVGTLDINGGTVNVLDNFGLGRSGGTGYVNINDGVLNLDNWDGADSIKGNSILDIRGGSLVIFGDERDSVNAHIAAGRITAYGDASTPVVDYNLVNYGKTTVIAGAFVPVPVGISARGDNPPDETAEKAFDNDDQTKWLDFSPDGSWIQYRYAGGAAPIVTQYAITSANDHPDRDPFNWELRGSNDEGLTWHVLDSRSGFTFTDRFQERVFLINYPAPYNIYRLRITAVADPGAANSVQLAELKLLETVFDIDDVVAHWKLDETAGAVAADYSGHGYEPNTFDGTLINMDDSDWVPGRTGNALDFDGVNDYVAVDDICTALAGKDLTVSAWVKAPTLNPATQFMISINSSGGNNNKLLMGTPAGTATLSLADSVPVWRHTTATVIDNTWHHVAYVLDDSFDIITVYVDGSEVLSFTSTISIAADDVFSLAQEYDAGMATGDFYDGMLDDIRVYNRALSAADIETLAQ